MITIVSEQADDGEPEEARNMPLRVEDISEEFERDVDEEVKAYNVTVMSLKFYESC